MEFGPEANEGYKEQDRTNDVTEASIPDLSIKPDEPAASNSEVTEPAVSKEMLPQTDTATQDYIPEDRTPIDPERDTAHLKDMAHIEGEPLWFRYN